MSSITARPLVETERQAALALALRQPLRNALIIADLTQLASDSVAIGAWREGDLCGVGTCYRTLPFPAVALLAQNEAVLNQLLHELTVVEPVVGQEEVTLLCDGITLKQLQRVAQVVSIAEEQCLVVPPAGLPPRISTERWHPVPITARHLQQIKALHRVVSPMAWTDDALELGPHRGIFVGGQLVCMAGVHFMTPWVTEIGNVVTHPDFRRRGMAEAVTRSVVEALTGRTERIFLMVFTDNQAAIRLYTKMGFQPAGVRYLVGFRVWYS
ncbi:MAG TPA: GNAT family N-acetyltransferase [Anaerolineae bacterium]|nr:GNAT family N-acetyltransferase [Anaerolineae bacterium]